MSAAQLGQVHLLLMGIQGACLVPLSAAAALRTLAPGPLCACSALSRAFVPKEARCQEPGVASGEATLLAPGLTRRGERAVLCSPRCA